MQLVQAVVLGIVQGLAEFLPISSSAHLIVVPWLFGWPEPGLAFDAALHLGTLVAVLCYFWRDLLAIARVLSRPGRLVGGLRASGASATPADPAARLAVLIAIGTLPGVLTGLFAEQLIEDFFHDAANQEWAIVVVACLLILLGLVLWLADRGATGRRRTDDLSLRAAIVIGLAQAAALVPGVSRSGATLTAGLVHGLCRADAARFSFLLGIPLIAGAGATSIFDTVSEGVSRGEAEMFAAGMLASAVAGIAAIWALLRYLQRSRLSVFVAYRLALGLALLLLVAAR